MRIYTVSPRGDRVRCLWLFLSVKPSDYGCYLRGSLAQVTSRVFSIATDAVSEIVEGSFDFVHARSEPFLSHPRVRFDSSQTTVEELEPRARVSEKRRIRPEQSNAHLSSMRAFNAVILSSRAWIDDTVRKVCASVCFRDPALAADVGDLLRTPEPPRGPRGLGSCRCRTSRPDVSRAWALDLPVEDE